MTTAQVTIPLDLPDIRVLQSALNSADELIITVESLHETALCRWCGQTLQKFHGYAEWVQVRYLAVFGRPTYVRYRPKRYRCADCPSQPTTTQSVTWHVSQSPNSLAYERHILLQLVNTTLTDVSVKEQLSYDSVLGILERNISAEVDWGQYTRLDRLGLDEIALKKGHRAFVVIVTARIEGRVVILGVLADRKKETVAKFLRAIPERLKQTITTACSDMYEGYTEAIREELPGVRLVIDRFHVARTYRAGLDTLRKTEMRRLKSTLATAEYKALKGSMWALRKDPQALTPEEQATLAILFQRSPDLKAAYELQTQLTEIFETPLAVQAAETKIRHWLTAVAHSGVQCFAAFIGTLEQWWTEILNYFVARETSGFVEGFNNKLKVLKRRCYGLTQVSHLFQRIYLDLEGYRLFA